MARRLDGKHALITGGNRGIGEGIVRLFVEEGARVVFTGRDVEPGEKIAKELDVFFRRLEIADQKQWNTLGQEFAEDPFDILVNNAGGLLYAKPLLELTLEEWQREIDVNLTGAFLGMKTFMPAMLERSSGSIINIGSISGVRAQIDGTAYQSAKAGLRWLTKNVAMTYAESGVRVNIINPGVIVTPLHHQQPTKRLKWFTDKIPMQRNGVPYEVATAVVYLASDESSYITGVDLDVDGGFNL